MDNGISLLFSVTHPFLLHRKELARDAFLWGITPILREFWDLNTYR
ncbi:TPA: hypothetical protein RUY03_005022 [Escherichia coli]|nr:hypothetical protein [Escherichia coli]